MRAALMMTNDVHSDIEANAVWDAMDQRSTETNSCSFFSFFSILSKADGRTSQRELSFLSRRIQFGVKFL